MFTNIKLYKQIGLLTNTLEILPNIFLKKYTIGDQNTVTQVSYPWELEMDYKKPE